MARFALFFLISTASVLGQLLDLNEERLAASSPRIVSLDLDCICSPTDAQVKPDALVSIKAAIAASKDRTQRLAGYSACAKQFSHEDCVNADASLRATDSLCSYMKPSGRNVVPLAGSAPLVMRTVATCDNDADSKSFTIGTTPVNGSTRSPGGDVGDPAVSDAARGKGTPKPAIRKEGRLCFPSTATVQLYDGSFKTMDEVELGDKLLVSSGQYSEVFMFTHKLRNVQYEFVNLKTDGGELSLTSGHYIYVNGNLVAAKLAKVGDTLESASGDLVRIDSISRKVMTGLFNPQTVHGDIVVDGIRASTYTTVAAPKAAHAMLAPLRSLYTRFGGMATCMLDGGSDILAKGVSAMVA